MMVWTAERIDALTRLWADGYSARQIADKLGGVTRNAVIGKAHRLNLQRGAVKSPPPPEPVIVVPVRIEPPPIDAPEMRSWMCRSPTDDPGKYGLHICGKTCQPGRLYCAEHLTAAYVRRKRTAA
ncbi:MAG: global cell cycle regulator GcrA-like protein [Alphaproteobacteria bacterium]|nr:global cell cycle regulator GcrA-like protein [Alphaproteobacteria bacterium]